MQKLKSQYILILIFFLAFIFRIYEINQPLVGVHSWKQCDTAAIARNYYENGYNFFYPQIDWRGNTSGVAETEFPVYSFIVSLIYHFVDVYEPAGRFVSLTFFILLIFFLYNLVFILSNQSNALWVVFIYSILPMTIYYSRAFMPDQMMITCSVIGLYYGLKWVKNNNECFFILSASFISLAVLIKLTSLYLVFPVIYIFILKYGKLFIIRIKTWLYFIIVMLPVVLWYAHAHQLYLTTGLTYGIWGYGTDKWGIWWLLSNYNFYKIVFWERLCFGLTKPGFIIFIIALFYRLNDEENIIRIWLLSVLFYFFVVSGGNYVHDYYQLPFWIPAAYFIGKFYSENFILVGEILIVRLKKIILLVILILICINSYRTYSEVLKNLKINDISYEKLYVSINEVKQLTAPKDLVVVLGNNDPTFLYFIGRKGWLVTIEQLTKEYLKSKILNGAKYLIGFNSDLKNKKIMKEQYFSIYEDQFIFIVKLT